MPSIGCSWPDCDYRTEDIGAGHAVQLLSLHAETHRQANLTPVTAPPVREKVIGLYLLHSIQSGLCLFHACPEKATGESADFKLKEKRTSKKKNQKIVSLFM